MTWAEFVEAALLRQYRRNHDVPMGELRAFIDVLRDRCGVPYPLADRRPYVADRQLVLEAQDEAGLSADFCLVAAVRGQTILTPPSASFLERVAWEGDVATGWRPHDEPGSPVLMASDVRFGKPAVKGISTEVLWEHAEAGEDDDEIAGAFDLTLNDVRWALAYETSVRAARPGQLSRRPFASTLTLTYSAWPRGSSRCAPTSPTPVTLAVWCTRARDRQVRSGRRQSSTRCGFRGSRLRAG